MAKKKKINVLKNSEDTWLKGPQLETRIVDYFQSFFLASMERGAMDFLSSIERRLTKDMQKDLSRPFVEEEVVTALKQMHLNKALRPDGLATNLFLGLLACC